MFHSRKIKSSSSHSLNKVEFQGEHFQWFFIVKHFFSAKKVYQHFLGYILVMNRSPLVISWIERKKGEKLPLNLIQVKNKWMEMSDFDNKILFLLNRCSRSLQNARTIINKWHRISNTNCNINPYYAKLTMLKLVMENFHPMHFYVSCPEQLY